MKNEKSELISKKIADVEMPVRLKNALTSNGIETVGQITAMTKFNVMMLNSFGKKRIDMLNEFLEKNNLELKAF